jgi:hypothetical protein
VRVATFIVFLTLPLLGLAEPFSVEHAAELEKALRATTDPAISPKVSYPAYVTAFPDTFDGLARLHSIEYRQVLAIASTATTPEVYIVTMCAAYEYVDHRSYFRKLLRIGIGADNWGGTGRHRQRSLYPGDAYLRLMHGTACGQPTHGTLAERRAHIYALAPEFSDAEIESIYNSLSWDGEIRSPLDWFLRDLCGAQPSRCELTRRLHDRYIANKR